MHSVMGVDGCKGGWATIRHSDDGSLEVRVIESFEQVRTLPDVVAIDIPIGLSDDGPRQCDVLARTFVGPRSSSVFPAPVRAVLGCEDYESAREASVKAQGASLSAQCFGIVPKICEVDRVLVGDPRLRERTFEVHPEVSFTAWNDGPLSKKKSPEGSRERLELVESFFGRYAFEFAREFLPRGTVQDDDILDAYAATWTAWRIAAGIARSLPDVPPTDSMGLEMAIWY